MKKLFNYALLAAALLVGVNVNAQKFYIKQGDNERTENTLKDAVDAVIVDGGQATITLLADYTLIGDHTSGEVIYIKDGKDIILDLNGKNITMESSNWKSHFEINNGKLRLASLAANSVGNLELYGVYAASRYPNSYDYPDLQQNVSNYYGIKLTGATQLQENEVYSKLEIDENINYTLSHNGYAIQVANNDGYAEGVVIEVAGNVTSGWSALTINGQINKAKKNRAYIHLASTGKFVGPNDMSLSTEAGEIEVIEKYYHEKKGKTQAEAHTIATTQYKSSSAAIYAAGVGKYLIEGTVEGGVGIYVKAGSLEIKNAVVKATADEYWPPICWSDGYLGCGTAIILDSHEDYGVLEGVKIEGSVISSDNGFAIEEDATKGDSDLPVIEVISGTFVGGITTTPEERAELVNRNSITGGEWHGQDVSQYINSTKNTIIYFVDGDGVTYEVVVPITDSDWSTSIATAAAQTEKPKYAKVTANEDVENDTEVEFVRIPKDVVVTVKSGAVLDAGTLMIEGPSTASPGGETGKIIVEAGGTLIVSGKQGAYTYNENSLVIEASKSLVDEITSGQILINPAVVLNTTPKATVQYVGNSYYDKVNSQFVFDFFGAPFVAGSVTSFAASGDQQYATQVDVNRGGTNWENVGTIIAKTYNFNLSKFDTPFGFYQLTSNNPSTALQTFTMQGEIFGNTNAQTNFRSGWPGFSNAYMATANIVKFGEVLMNQGCDASIYTYEQIGPNTLAWNPNNEIEGLSELRPMQAFMLRNAGAARTVNTDYTKMVWNPAMGVNQAPRMTDMSKASIRVEAANGVYDRVTLAQDEQFSNEYENGYDAEKYMNTDLNIYVSGEKNLAILATDNVENTILGFNCKNAGKYTMTFSKLRGDNFALIDLVNNRRIEMNEGTTYEFLANAGEDAYRFMIVRGAQTPTDMQKTNAAVKTTKALINNQIVISNGDRFFNVLGTEVK